MRNCHFIPGRIIACDTETTGVRTWNGDRPFAFSFANRMGDSAYFEFPVDPFTRRVQYDRKPKLFNRLRRFFQDPDITTVWHNAKFDVRNLDLAGFGVPAGTIEDTEILARVTVSNELTYELKPLANRYGDFPKDDQAELRTAVGSLRTQAKKLGFAIAPKGEGKSDYWLIQHAKRILVESLATRKDWARKRPGTRAKERLRRKIKAREWAALCERYAVIDAERTIFLWELFREICKEQDCWETYLEEMRELWPVNYAMETRGVYLHRPMVKHGRDLAAKQLKKETTTIEKLGGKGFNYNSSPQMQRYFIKKLKLEPLQFTKPSDSFPNGQPKLDKLFLAYYENETPMAGAIVRAKKADKAIGTYFDNYLELMDDDGIIHAGFQQMGAKTGRYSCRFPNFQNIPKHGRCLRCLNQIKIKRLIGDSVYCDRCERRTPLDPMLGVRRPFGPRPDHVWYLGDYRQIEARLFADYAGEEFMLDCFANDRDVYQEFADLIESESGVFVGRQVAKNIFLGKLYGLGIRKLIRMIMEESAGEDVGEDDAYRVVDTFGDLFPRVPEFMQETIREVRRNGFVTNRYGQRIDVGKDEAYKGVNYLIQSSAARLMKRAMIRVHAYLVSIGFGWLVMTIHDELIFEFEKRRRPKGVLRQIKRIMEDNQGMFNDVETLVDFEKVTESWLEKSDCRWSAAA